MSSLIFVPADNIKLHSKVGTLPCGVIADLEDGVVASRKSVAREGLVNLSSSLHRPHQTFYVRINAVHTAFWKQDLAVAVQVQADGIVVPKAENVADIQMLDSEISRIEEEYGVPVRSMKLCLLFETAQGLNQMENLLAASPRVRSASLGMADLCTDIGVSWKEGYANHPAAWSAQKIELVLLSRALRIEPPWDVVYLNYRDTEGFENDARVGKALGFQGKLVIHPAQVDIVNSVYRVGFDAYEEAKAMIREFEKTVEFKRGTVGLKGQMLDEPVIRNARQIVERFQKQQHSKSPDEGAST